MKDFKKHIISSKASIIEAMERLNQLPENLTLFVCDSNGQMVGTLTDGDVRRGFTTGLSLEEPVSSFQKSNFTFVEDGIINTKIIKEYREKGLHLIPVLNQKMQIVRVYDLKKKRNILPLECMIMAGGRGERLRPLTDKKPKPLLLVGKKPIIEHNLDRLISFGIEKFYISIKYLGDQIKDYLGDGSSKGVEIEYIEEDEPLGTAGALTKVKKFNSEYILLMNSDLFTDIDFEDLYFATCENKADMGIASIPYTINIPYAIFDRIDENIISLKEKPDYTYYANAGIYILKKELIRFIPKEQFYNITDLIEFLLSQKYKIIHNPLIGYWVDIGKHEDYNKVQELAKHIYH